MKSNTTPDLPAWVTEAEFTAWDKKYPEFDLVELQSFTKKGTKLQAIVRRPDEIATLMSRGKMSQMEGNNIAAAQQVLGQRCTLKISPELAEEYKVDEYKHQHEIALGRLIGNMYPQTEAVAKKKLKGI